MFKHIDSLPYLKKITIGVGALALLVLFELFAYSFLTKEYSERKNNYLSTISQEWEEEYNSLTDNYVMVTNTIFHTLHNDGRLVRILKQANATRDFKKAHDDIITTYSDLNTANEANSILRIFQIHDDKGNVLVRFQKPNAYADNVLGYLGVVTKTHKSKEVVQGFACGKYYNGYRFVYPVMEDGVFLGSVQLGFEETALVAKMQEHFNIKTHLSINNSNNFIKNDDISQSPLSTASKKFVYHNKAYSKESRELLELLFKDSKKELDTAINNGDKLVFSTQIDKKHYVVVTEPFVDFDDQPAGYLTLYTQNTNLPLMQKEYFISLALGCLLAALLWGIIVSIALRGYDKDIQLGKEVAKRLEKEKLLIQQSKMAMMGEMIGAIAHQWRQPLNTLSLIVQEVQLAYRCGDVNETYLEQFTKNAMDKIIAMSKTIDDFRNFFSPNKKAKSFFIEDAIDESLKLLDSQLANHSIQIIQEDTENKHAYNGYKNELKQVLLNIFANAKDAIIDGKSDERYIKVSVSQTDDGVSIDIRDSGGGIANEIIDKVFDPHFTTKPEGKGTGIGLYMSKQIVESSFHGKIYVSNTEKGALFTIILKSL